MTDEAHKLVREMEELSKTNVTAAPLRELKITACFARLLVTVAEEQEKAAAKMERQTEKIIRLTWGLFWLTLALAFVAAIQLYTMLK